MNFISDITVSLETAKVLLPALEQNVAVLTKERDALTQRIEAARASIAEISAKINDGGQSTTGSVSGSSKRLRKGAAEKIIADLLKGLSIGSGLSTSDIISKTGLNASAVYRTLKKNKTGKFVETDGDWSIKN